DRTAQRPGGVECLLVGATYGVARGCVGLEPSAGAAVGGPPRITRGAHLHMSVEHGLAETHRTSRRVRTGQDRRRRGAGRHWPPPAAVSAAISRSRAITRDASSWVSSPADCT